MDSATSLVARDLKNALVGLPPFFKKHLSIYTTQDVHIQSNKTMDID